MDLWRHWLRHGKAEGRAPAPIDAVLHEGDLWRGFPRRRAGAVADAGRGPLPGGAHPGPLGAGPVARDAGGVARRCPPSARHARGGGLGDAGRRARRAAARHAGLGAGRRAGGGARGPARDAVHARPAHRGGRHRPGPRRGRGGDGGRAVGRPSPGGARRADAGAGRGRGVRPAAPERAAALGPAARSLRRAGRPAARDRDRARARRGGDAAHCVAVPVRAELARAGDPGRGERLGGPHARHGPRRGRGRSTDPRPAIGGDGRIRGAQPGLGGGARRLRHGPRRRRLVAPAQDRAAGRAAPAVRRAGRHGVPLGARHARSGAVDLAPARGVRLSQRVLPPVPRRTAGAAGLLGPRARERRHGVLPPHPHGVGRRGGGGGAAGAAARARTLHARLVDAAQGHAPGHPGLGRAAPLSRGRDALARPRGARRAAPAPSPGPAPLRRARRAGLGRSARRAAARGPRAPLAALRRALVSGDLRGRAPRRHGPGAALRARRRRGRARPRPRLQHLRLARRARARARGEPAARLGGPGPGGAARPLAPHPRAPLARAAGAGLRPPGGA